MLVFIAGTHNTGACVANSTVVTRSLAKPFAARAMRFAVAGATSTKSAQSASSIWPTRPSSAASNKVERTGRPLTVAKLSSVTKAEAASVVMTWTS